MKEYNSPEFLIIQACKEDVLRASYGERFGVVLDWNDDVEEDMPC